MTYDYDHTTDGEQHLATARELEQSGFTIHEADSDAGPGEDQHDPLEGLFGGGPDLETREGVERALGRARREMEAERV